MSGDVELIDLESKSEKLTDEQTEVCELTNS